jgi:hypothetical protein
MIKSERVSEIFTKCLFKPEEIIDGKPVVEPLVGKGVLNDFGFHPQRLPQYINELTEMLRELPDSFMKSKGGGMSFLNACMTKDDVQWGEHRDIEQLFAMGEALKIVSYPMPREMWSILPGGMPYVTVIDD